MWQVPTIRTRFQGLRIPSTKLLCALLVGAGAGHVSFLSHRQRQEQARPLGRMTCRQALDRSEPLCRDIAPWVDTQTLYTMPSNGYTGRWWSIISEDRVGREVATMTWNADTGELYEVGGWPSNRGVGRQS